MAFTDTIMDVRNMQRAIQLRNIQDPKEVTNLLERVLRDAIVAQASGSKAFERKALKEMTQIRQDLVAGQINAGASKESMVGVYSHLLDQMNSMQKDNKKSSKISDNAFKQLTNSIPSADTFISALMTANPLVGYGVKIARDIMRATKTAANNQKTEKDKKLKVLADQEKYIKEQLKVLSLEDEKVKGDLKDKKGDKKDKVKSDSGLEKEIYAKLLEEIKENTKKLLEEWTGTSNVGSANVEAVNDPVITNLEKVGEDIKEQTNVQKEIAKDEIKAMESLERDKKRNTKLERLKDGSDVPAPNLNPLDDQIKKQSGGFGKLLEGLIAPLMILLRTGLIAFAGAALGLFTSLVAIPALIGTAVYKFLDGFFNAEEIIGKADKDITMLDRVKAGVANIWGTVLKIVDWVAELFGFDFIDSKDIEKRIYKVFDDAQTKIVDGFEYALKYAEIKYREAAGYITGIYDDLVKTFEKVSSFVTEKFDSLTQWFTDLKDKGLIETFRDMISEDDPRKDFNYRQDDGNWRGDVPLPSGPQTFRGDVPIPGTPQAPKVERAPDVNRPGIDVLPPPNPNPNILRMKTEPSNGQGISSSMRTAEANASKPKGTGTGPIVAPTTNNNSTNNHNYNGPPTTSNLDPDFRSMM